MPGPRQRPAAPDQGGECRRSDTKPVAPLIDLAAEPRLGLHRHPRHPRGKGQDDRRKGRRDWQIRPGGSGSPPSAAQATDTGASQANLQPAIDKTMHVLHTTKVSRRGLQRRTASDAAANLRRTRLRKSPARRPSRPRKRSTRSLSKRSSSVFLATIFPHRVHRL